MSDTLRVVPITTPEELAAARGIRARLAAQHTTHGFPTEADPNTAEPIHPEDAFVALFGYRVDAHVGGLVTRQYTWLRDHPFARCGSVYCFRDARDPEDLVKIGFTCVGTDKRLAQWKGDLQGHPRAPGLLQVFSFGCLAPFCAEKITHALLLPWKAHGLVNRKTGRSLTEYYWIGDTTQCRELVRAIVTHVNWYAHKSARAHQYGKTSSPFSAPFPL